MYSLLMIFGIELPQLIWVNLLLIVVGVILVLWGADRMTDGAVAIAQRLNVSEIGQQRYKPERWEDYPYYVAETRWDAEVRNRLNTE